MNVYKYFEKLMREKGLNAYQVSKATGIAQSTLCDWKYNRTQPKINKIMIIAKYFDVPVENFYMDEEINNA